MKYSPENFALMCAKLRLLGIKMPGMWLNVSKPDDDGISLTYVPFDKLDAKDVISSWDEFIIHAEYEIAKHTA